MQAMGPMLRHQAKLKEVHFVPIPYATRLCEATRLGALVSQFKSDGSCARATCSSIFCSLAQNSQLPKRTHAIASLSPKELLQAPRARDFGLRRFP